MSHQKPTNQFHVEDPQIAIGDYLSQVEVAPINLYLSNRKIGEMPTGEQVYDYLAEFDARNSIVVGNGIYSAKFYDFYLTPDGDFVIKNQSKVKMHSGYEIEFLPGTEVEYGSELEAYIEPYNCENLFNKNLQVDNETENFEENYEIEQPNLKNKTITLKDEVFIKVYPNPNNGNLYVECPSSSKQVDIIINNYTGKTVFRSRYPNNQIIQIDINDLENGIYLLHVNSGNSFDIFKIVITR